jgi:hypothetical protein
VIAVGYCCWWAEFALRLAWSLVCPGRGLQCAWLGLRNVRAGARHVLQRSPVMHSHIHHCHAYVTRASLSRASRYTCMAPVASPTCV